MFQEIYNVGYHHGTTFFCGLKKAGRSEESKEKASWLPTSDKARRANKVRDTRRESGNYSNFTDLAEMVMIGVKMNRKVSRTDMSDRSLLDPDSDDTGIMI